MLGLRHTSLRKYLSRNPFLRPRAAVGNYLVWTLDEVAKVGAHRAEPRRRRQKLG